MWVPLTPCSPPPTTHWQRYEMRAEREKREAVAAAEAEAAKKFTRERLEMLEKVNCRLTRTPPSKVNRPLIRCAPPVHTVAAMSVRYVGASSLFPRLWRDHARHIVGGVPWLMRGAQAVEYDGSSRRMDRVWRAETDAPQFLRGAGGGAQAGARADPRGVAPHGLRGRAGGGDQGDERRRSQGRRGGTRGSDSTDAGACASRRGQDARRGAAARGRSAGLRHPGGRRVHGRAGGRRACGVDAAWSGGGHRYCRGRRQGAHAQGDRGGCEGRLQKVVGIARRGCLLPGLSAES
eukprot:1776852-Prymnesium_polylepis.1